MISPFSRYMRGAPFAFVTLAALGALVCGERYFVLRRIETLVSSAVCGDMADHAVQLGRCSHCWGAAALVLLAVSIVMIASGLRQRMRPA